MHPEYFVQSFVYLSLRLSGNILRLIVYATVNLLCHISETNRLIVEQNISISFIYFEVL